MGKLVKVKLFIWWKEWKTYLKSALITFVIIRFISSLVIMILILIRPTYIQPMDVNTINSFPSIQSENIFTELFLTPWLRWDTVHYIGIAEFGYGGQELLSVWPPLYPFLLKAFSIIFQPPILAAIIVSNLFFITAIILFLKLVSETFDENIAKKSIYCLLLFPASFFLIAPYTESLFLTLSIAVFYLSRKKEWLFAGLLSAFAALTRVQGVLLVLPIFIEGMQVYFSKRDKKQLLQFLPATLLAPFAYGLFSLYVRFGLQNPLPWVSLRAHWGQYFAWPWEGFVGTITALFGRKIEYNVTLDFVKVLSVISIIVSLFFLVKISKKLPLSIITFSWVNFFLVISKVDNQNILISTMRYLLVIFPIFIGQALSIDKKWHQYVLLLLGLSLNIALLILSTWGLWVA